MSTRSTHTSLRSSKARSACAFEVGCCSHLSTGCLLKLVSEDAQWIHLWMRGDHLWTALRSGYHKHCPSEGSDHAELQLLDLPGLSFWKPRACEVRRRFVPLIHVKPNMLMVMCYSVGFMAERNDRKFNFTTCFAHLQVFQLTGDKRLDCIEAATASFIANGNYFYSRV